MIESISKTDQFHIVWNVLGLHLDIIIDVWLICVWFKDLFLFVYLLKRHTISNCHINKEQVVIPTHFIVLCSYFTVA